MPQAERARTVNPFHIELGALHVTTTTASKIDAATRKDMVKPREGVRLLELYESQMLNKTYLNIEPKNGRKKKKS